MSKKSNTAVVVSDVQVQEFETMHALSELVVAMPMPAQVVVPEDVDAILNDFGWELSVADQAQAMLDDALDFKAQARHIQETDVSPLFGMLKDEQLKREQIELEIDMMRNAIRDQLFSDPRIAEAIKLLQGHPAWKDLTSKIEKRVPQLLNERGAELLARLDVVMENVHHIDQEYEQALAKANEFGAAGNKLFADRAAMLKEHGFEVKEVVKPTK